jgi:predicted outer membrane repeat protein
MTRLRRALWGLAAALTLGSPVAEAATITVTSLLDNGVGCTLRNAVESSNSRASVGGCAAGGPSNEIVFVPNGTISLNSPPINIYQSSLTFTGNGPGNTIIDARNLDHAFDNYDPGVAVALSITWQNLTITRGNALLTGPTGFTSAGAIFVDTLTTATIANCVLSGNRAESSGGAVENWGTLSVIDSTFSSNVAVGEGGAIRNTGTLSVLRSTFTGNSANSGGALWHSAATAAGSASIVNSTFAGNSSTSLGGAIAADDSSGAGPVTLTHVTVAGNSSANGGGVFTNNGAAFNIDRTIIASNTATAAGPDCGVGAAKSLNSLNFNLFSTLSGCSVTGTTSGNVVNGSPQLGALASNGGLTQTMALLAGSPAIDIAGSCATAQDQRGIARPIGPACDAGAVEAPLFLTVGPASLPAAQVGASYSQTFTATNGTGPYTWSLSSGSLPAGLALNPSTGALTGTPTAGGTFNFTVNVVDNGTASAASKAYSLTVSAPVIAVAPATLPNGTVGVGYSQSFTPSGGTSPYSFSLTAGTLPPGLTLVSGGTLSGTPTTAATYNFTIAATDSSTGTGPYTGSRAYSVTILAPPPLTLNPTSVPAGQAGAAYSQSIAASGGTGPYNFTLSAGALPAGLSLAASGLLSGTPTAVGTFNFTVSASDTASASTGSRSYSLAIVAPTIAVAPATLPNGTFGTAYSQAVTASGGTAAYAFAVTAGALPSGLSLSPGGLISGTPAAAGTFNFTITATDSTTGTGAPFIGARAYTVTIAATVPGAPGIGAATAGDAQATVSFAAPSNGGSPITGYTVTASPGGATATGAASPITVTGLTNGTAYTFTVTAANSAGTGAPSAASNSVTPQAAQTITFANPGAQNFGTTPTLTATASSGLTVTFTSSTPAICTITAGGALTFVAIGSCTINANQAGNAAYTAAPTVSHSFTVNAVVPGAPTIGVATAGDAQATVTFTAPASNGGAVVTGYTVTASPGGATATGAASPITVTGLTNGTAYTFTVTATNSAGTSTPSAASNSVTPKGAQTITFANPGAQNFGTTPTLTATASSGLAVAFASATAAVCTVTTGGALTLVTTGTCTINADQAGNATFAAAPSVSRSFTITAVVPGAPVIGTATAGDAQATVTFSAPASNGGSAITGYTVTASPGGATATGASSPIIVAGLTNGTAYTFTVTATNSAGTSAPSAASNSVTPKGAQTITFANPGARNFGTTPALTATASSGLTVAFASSTAAVCTITTGGTLTFVTAGTCTINADQAGNASFLAAPTVSRSFTVNAVAPGAPTIGAATPGNASATVAFAAPASNGGSAITGYTATCNPGAVSATGSASPLTVAGLTGGTTYTCSVTATNAAGTSAASATVSVTAATVVTTFTGASPTGTGSITASFSGGGPLCTYTVSQFIPETGHAASPPAGSAPGGVVFPHGLFDFVLDGCTPGSSITMTITYPRTLAAGTQYWKYGPTSSDTAPHWYVIPAAIAGNTASFTIADGGLGDDDLAANGRIVDQGGPGFPTTVPTQVPTLSEWALLMLALLVGLMGIAYRPRKV